jgi:hypothetical protein
MAQTQDAMKVEKQKGAMAMRVVPLCSLPPFTLHLHFDSAQ